MARAGCIAVPTDRILARDLRDSLPFLADVNPETTLGFAPRPGVQRILSGRDLVLIARKLGLDGSGSFSGICVERAVRTISRDEMTAALRSAIGQTNVELELMDFSREPLPPGRLEFNSAQLDRPHGEDPGVAVIWRGVMRYDRQSSMPVWAIVKVSTACVFLRAARDIPAGAVIDATQVNEVPGRRFPSGSPPIEAGTVLGKIARHRIPAGQRFFAGDLNEPSEISRGDTVHVTVVVGSATLLLDAIAQSSGKKGESILVHNPVTGKTFRAEVEEKGKAAVRPSPGA
jgi:flagella basal body P-ring formation protein FlgA